MREVRPDGHTLTITPDAPPGLYQLVLSFYDPATFEPLPAVDARSGEAIPAGERKVALVQVGEPATIAAIDPPFRFGDLAHLAGAAVETSDATPAALTVRLQWDVLTTPTIDYTTFVHVVNSAGELVAQQDQPPLAGFAPTHTWQPGQRIIDAITLSLPTDLPPDQYTVRLGLYAGEPVCRSARATRRLGISPWLEALIDDNGTPKPID